jgi:iron complex transport system substrate-binding protein
MYSQKKIIFIFSILTLTLLITGCANRPETLTESASGSSSETNDSNYPLTITHALGETVIESRPERIATISWGNQDTPLALGVLPVGVSTANYGVTDGSGLLPWTKEAFENLGITEPLLFDDVAGLDFEAISDVQPDVILAAYSGLTQEEYDLLSEIAPVVAYPTAPWQTFWRDQIIYDAMGMGMEAEGKALVSDLEQLIEEKTATYPELNGIKAAFFYFNPTDLGKFYVYLPSDPRAAYLLDLGMEFPDSVKALTEDSSSFAIELSAENVDRLDDIDLIITYGTDGLLDSLQNDPLIGTLPAVQRGSVAIIEDATPLAASGTPSALSIPATIDEYLAILAEAVNTDQ